MEKNNNISFEKSMLKNYKKAIWSKFTKGIRKYSLIEDGDKIAVAMSGGKDSLLLAKLFQELKKHPKMDFEIEFITMDPGFNAENLNLIIKNSNYLDIPINIEKSNNFNIIESIAKDNPCYLCARMRRGFLYNMAKERGCNKLALGHHFDDVIETTLLNVLYAGTFETMQPKVKSKNFEGIELIRPMYLIHEQDIIDIMKENNIETMGCGCEIATCNVSSKRQEIKKLIKEMKLKFNDIDKNIFRSAENVNLDNIARWKKDGKEFSSYKNLDD